MAILYFKNLVRDIIVIAICLLFLGGVNLHCSFATTRYSFLGVGGGGFGLALLI